MSKPSGEDDISPEDAIQDELDIIELRNLNKQMRDQENGT